ncbi:MAG: methionyl-tRNA formyltransferase [Actinomycetota bacterium]|nr:methionyl-tRNA formyltransferase [Actinomycetota bacterium]
MSFDEMGRVCLEATAEAGANVVGVVTLPGPIDPYRSGQATFDDLAERYGAPLIETLDINEPATVEAVAGLEPELIFVVGWSQLVRADFIALAPKGVFGMHPTLLPRHRGRAAIPWTILNGLARTGVTLFEIVDPTADSGPIVAQREVPVAPDETATSLYDKHTDAHMALLREYVPKLIDGTAPRIPQDVTRASAWPKRTPADGIIDWNTRAPYLYDWVRAQTRPYPGAFTFAGDERVVVWQARPASLEQQAPPGTIVAESGGGPIVACGEGALVLEEVETDAELPVGALLG